MNHSLSITIVMVNLSTWVGHISDIWSNNRQDVVVKVFFLDDINI